MKFALITEGASEHRVIKHILSRYCKDSDPVINQIQPKLNKGKQLGIGGWNEVLKYCERKEELEAALVENDYIVIQIDTDMSEIEPYSVNKMEEGQYIGHDKLWDKVRERLESALPETISRDKIIYAISIHTIECWLLPVFYTDGKRCNVNNCLDTLNAAITKKNLHKITDKNSFTSARVYDEILNNIKKQKDILACASYNVGFNNFVSQLNAVLDN